MRWGGPTPDPDLEGRYSFRAPRHHNLGMALIVVGLFFMIAVIAAVIRLL